MQVTENSPGLSDVPGFLVGGAACDIRRKNDPARLDVAVAYSKRPCTAAGVFTTNDVKAAPVRVCKDRLEKGGAFHGFVANSGNANACTGPEGMQDARDMAAQAAAACGAPANSFLVCSTGRIGVRMPMDRMNAGIKEAARRLASTPEEGTRAAQAILTSDTRPKTITVRFDWQGKTVTVAGMAKGAGMIEPGMATMLAFVCTDAEASPELLRTVVRRAAGETFNRITVDGDMSTNDTVLLFANGASGVPVTEAQAELLKLFQDAVTRVCAHLAEKIVGDGEKITKVVEVLITGAQNDAAAEKIARAIGNSLLVKSSWYGNDPNWGRLTDAAGYARTGLDEDKLDLDYDTTPVLRAGRPVWENKDAWKAVVSKPRFSVRMNLNLGKAHFRLLSTDLSEAYVNFNKSE